jgi:hypothetical protein
MPEAGVPEASGDDGAMTMCGQGLPTSSDFQTLVRTCLFVVSCDPYYFTDTISACITDDYLEASSSLTCLRTVASCADFTACWGVGLASLSDCPTAGASARCDANNRAINCNDQANGAVNDCRTRGGMCATYVDPTSNMMTADCLVNPTCTETDGLDHCISNTPSGSDYICIGGKGYGEDCGGIHSTCATAGGSSGCYFDNPSCQSPGYACTTIGGNSTVAWCSDAKQAFNFNCARAGLSCAVDDLAGTGDCVAPGCTLTDAQQCTEACGSDKKTMSICIGGASVAIDCTQYGFTGCTQSTSKDGTTYSYCVQ